MRDDLMIGDHVIEVPPPLGRCRYCGTLSWMVDAEGRPAHPCCIRSAPGECEGCRVSEVLENGAAQRMASYRRLRDARAGK